MLRSLNSNIIPFEISHTVAKRWVWLLVATLLWTGHVLSQFIYTDTINDLSNFLHWANLRMFVLSIFTAYPELTETTLLSNNFPHIKVCLFYKQFRQGIIPIFLIYSFVNSSFYSAITHTSNLFSNIMLYKI